LGSAGFGGPVDDPKPEWNVGAQGRVVLEVHGNELLIMEGLNPSTMDRLRAAIVPPAGTIH
jgi:hypothetical protein